MSDAKMKAMKAIHEHVLDDHDETKIHTVDDMTISFGDLRDAWFVKFAEGRREVVTIKDMLWFMVEGRKAARFAYFGKDWRDYSIGSDVPAAPRMEMSIDTSTTPPTLTVLGTPTPADDVMIAAIAAGMAEWEAARTGQDYEHCYRTDPVFRCGVDAVVEARTGKTLRALSIGSVEQEQAAKTNAGVDRSDIWRVIEQAFMDGNAHTDLIDDPEEARDRVSIFVREAMEIIDRDSITEDHLTEMMSEAWKAGDRNFLISDDNINHQMWEDIESIRDEAAETMEKAA